MNFEVNKTSVDGKDCVRINVNNRFSTGFWQSVIDENPDWIEDWAIPRIAKHFASEFDYEMTDADKTALRKALK